MDTVIVTVLLLSTVVVSAVLTRALGQRVPLPLVQIALGSALDVAHPLDLSLSPDTFFLLFLAPLLFLDGWRLPREGLFADKGTIVSLAFGLVCLTVAGVGAFIHWLIPTFTMAGAFALAAILSPTDTVAVTSMAARLPLPPRLMLILEGESLLNDASGIVCFRFAMAAAATGTFSAPQALGTFVWVAVIGLMVGAAVCLVANAAKDWVARSLGEEVGVQVLVSLIIPFVAYLLADALHASGILAAVAAGITMGVEERAGRASAVTRIRRRAVWDAVAFAGNGAIFVVLGQQLPAIIGAANRALGQAAKDEFWWLGVYVAAICAVLTLIRALWAWVALRFRQPTGQRWRGAFTLAELRVVGISAVAGARGAVTLAAAMAIPLQTGSGEPWPARDLSIFLAAGVIVVSLVCASLGLYLLTDRRRVPLSDARRMP
ncbi:Na+/H+ antiporter [Luteibacter aegosomaticola]|uniref:Na+/H+ antiporter n=1 Tax=Luteibacter aegosomaticola TaxID=2911538 RepID=UPI001FFA5420|nr:Na+/H+ antiporter [Luteibacter aegosomaticola]UPG88200.1 Na+/H+ antiporter [Luteibacter aegosomaticola]